MIDKNEWLCCLPYGWHELFSKMCEEINAACEERSIQDQYQLLEVKEKYGCMRIYDWMKNYIDVPADITNIVRHYEQESLRTCPICGKRKLPKHDMCMACARRYEEMAKGVADDEMLP